METGLLRSGDARASAEVFRTGTVAATPEGDPAEGRLPVVTCVLALVKVWVAFSGLGYLER